MISLIQSLWRVPSQGVRLCYLAVINFLYLGIAFALSVNGFIPIGLDPIDTISLANVIFWFIIGFFIIGWRNTLLALK